MGSEDASHPHGSDSTGAHFHNQFEGPVDAVVQAGTFNGQINFHYEGDRAPLDLYALRLWIDRISRDYRAHLALDDSRSEPEHLARVEGILGHTVDAPNAKAKSQRDMIWKLLISGIAAYLAQAGRAPRTPLPEQVLLDIIVFSVWPIVTARKLPDPWQGHLAMLTSPRLAALVAQTREAYRPGEAAAAEGFARRVANREFAPAMIRLFESLGDPRRGGAVLTSLAVVGGFEAPPRGGARRVLTWVIGAVAGAAALEVVVNPDSHLGNLIEAAVDDLPIDHIGIDLSDLFAAIVSTGLEEGT